MSNLTINRHEWLKAVNQDDCIADRAKVIAVAFWTFANDETGQLNPTVPTLANFVKRNIATVKRAVADLVDAGWLGKTEGRGRGNKTRYTLLSRGKIAALNERKKGADTSETKGAELRLYGEEKGAALSTKGCKTAPFRNKDKQPLEQKRARRQTDQCYAAERFADHCFDDNPMAGPRIVLSTDHASLNAWAEWLDRHGFPKQCHLPIRQDAEKGNVFGFYLPTKKPPTTPAAEAEAKWYFETLMDSEAATHAAQ